MEQTNKPDGGIEKALWITLRVCWYLWIVFVAAVVIINTGRLVKEWLFQ